MGIELWEDGHYAHYGEDHHISDLDDCADMCDSHNECAGFYTKDGKCSHWRSGDISAVPNAGHTCYVKDASSFLDLSDEDEEEEDWSISIGQPNGGGGWNNGGHYNGGGHHHHHMGMGMHWHMGMGMHW